MRFFRPGILEKGDVPSVVGMSGLEPTMVEADDGLYVHVDDLNKEKRELYRCIDDCQETIREQSSLVSNLRDRVDRLDDSKASLVVKTNRLWQENARLRQENLKLKKGRQSREKTFVPHRGDASAFHAAFDEAQKNPGKIAECDPWPHRSDKVRCQTCMYFVALSSAAGRCRRNAPAGNGFPVVCESDWCGDHKSNEQAE